MAAWRKVCCAVDFSTCSEEALARAAELARRLEAQLVLLHVQVDDDADALWPHPEVHQSELDRREAMAADWGRQASVIRGQVVDKAVVRARHMPEAIASFAAREGCELIVVGTHGRQGMRRLLLGSVAEKIVRIAPCSVLIVRPAKDAPERR